MKDRRKLIRLEDSKLWQKSQKIAHLFHDIEADLSPDERIMAGYRIRSTSFSLTSNIAEFEGATHYRDCAYPLSMARKDVFSLKNSYRYLGVQKALKIDPDVMVSIEDLINDIENEVNQAWRLIDALEAETLKK